MTRSLFVIDGIDGSGKSHCARVIAHGLEAEGRATTVCHVERWTSTDVTCPTAVVRDAPREAPATAGFPAGGAR